MALPKYIENKLIKSRTLLATDVYTEDEISKVRSDIEKFYIDRYGEHAVSKINTNEARYLELQNVIASFYRCEHDKPVVRASFLKNIYNNRSDESKTIRTMEALKYFFSVYSGDVNEMITEEQVGKLCERISERQNNRVNIRTQLASSTNIKSNSQNSAEGNFDKILKAFAMAWIAQQEGVELKNVEIHYNQYSFLVLLSVEIIVLEPYKKLTVASVQFVFQNEIPPSITRTMQKKMEVSVTIKEIYSDIPMNNVNQMFKNYSKYELMELFRKTVRDMFNFKNMTEIEYKGENKRLIVTVESYYRIDNAES